jgi:hypothetical protein
MIPIRMAELADVPKTVAGFKMVNAVRALVPAINFLLFIFFMVLKLNFNSNRQIISREQ